MSEKNCVFCSFVFQTCIREVTLGMLPLIEAYNRQIDYENSGVLKADGSGILSVKDLKKLQMGHCSTFICFSNIHCKKVESNVWFVVLYNDEPNLEGFEAAAQWFVGFSQLPCTFSRFTGI